MRTDKIYYFARHKITGYRIRGKPGRMLKNIACHLRKVCNITMSDAPIHTKCLIGVIICQCGQFVGYNIQLYKNRLLYIIIIGSKRGIQGTSTLNHPYGKHKCIALPDQTLQSAIGVVSTRGNKTAIIEGSGDAAGNSEFVTANVKYTLRENKTVQFGDGIIMQFYSGSIIDLQATNECSSIVYRDVNILRFTSCHQQFSGFKFIANGTMVFKVSQKA